MSAPADHGAWSRAHSWIGAQTGWRGAALSAAAGGLGALAHAPFHIVPVLAIAITVLVWRIDGIAFSPRRRWKAFARTWWFGLGYFLAGTYWIGAAFLVDPDLWGPVWGVPATLALAALLALFWAAALGLFVGSWTRDWRRIALVTLALMSGELARGHLFGGFPWNLPGYVWPAGGPVSQLAASLGIYGLSALTLLAAASPATLADTTFSRGVRLAPIFAAALGVGLAWGAGLQRLARAPEGAPAAAPIIRVADPGMSQAQKWRREPDQEWRVLARYAAVTGSADGRRAQIVIWPEGAIPAVNTLLLESPPLLSAIGALLGDRALILGFTRRAYDETDEVHYYNSAGIIDGVAGQPRVAQIYDKHRLVPFGEFIPLWSLIGGANIAPLQEIGAGFTPGAPPARLIVPDAPPAVALICYEAIFPGLTPHGPDRPGWIVTITNDSWFGRGAGPWQHFNMARYRAIEEGLPMARAASGGISAIVDAYGRAVAKTGLEGGAAEAQLPAELPPTLYSRLGNLLTPLVFFVVFVLCMAPTPRGAGGARK